MTCQKARDVLRWAVMKGTSQMELQHKAAAGWRRDKEMSSPCFYAVQDSFGGGGGALQRL